MNQLCNLFDGNLADGQSLLRNVDGARDEIVVLLLIDGFCLLGLQMLLVVPDVSGVRHAHISEVDWDALCVRQAALGGGTRIALIARGMLLLDADVLLD